jgi:hypothetical protein
MLEGFRYVYREKGLRVVIYTRVRGPEGTVDFLYTTVIKEQIVSTLLVMLTVFEEEGKSIGLLSLLDALNDYLCAIKSCRKAIVRVIGGSVSVGLLI